MLEQDITKALEDSGVQEKIKECLKYDEAGFIINVNGCVNAGNIVVQDYEEIRRALDKVETSDEIDNEYIIKNIDANIAVADEEFKRYMDGYNSKYKIENGSVFIAKFRKYNPGVVSLVGIMNKAGTYPRIHESILPRIFALDYFELNLLRKNYTNSGLITGMQTSTEGSDIGIKTLEQLEYPLPIEDIRTDLLRSVLKVVGIEHKSKRKLYHTNNGFLDLSSGRMIFE